MKRYSPVFDRSGLHCDEYDDGEYLKRDDVIDALATGKLALDEGLDLVLEALGISEKEYEASVDRNHPGPDPDYDGSSVLDYSRGVR